MKNNLHYSQKGFTIIESLIAIAILSVTVIGVTTAVQTGLSSYIFSKDQIVAFYLAQEGVEQIRNIRDENRLTGSNWLAGIAQIPTDPCYLGKACRVSPVESSTVTECTAVGSCPLLGKDSTTGFFGYDSAWPLTNFRREITTSPINTDEIAVTVKVTWTKGLATREFKVRENLFNWQ